MKQLLKQNERIKMENIIEGGFEIHMAGITKQVSVMVDMIDEDENEGGVVLSTVFPNGESQLIIARSIGASVVEFTTGNSVIVLNTELFKTALLVNKEGDSEVACFTTEMCNSIELTKSLYNRHTDSYEAQLMDNSHPLWKHVVKAFSKMDALDNWAKFKFEDRYTEIISQYI